VDRPPFFFHLFFFFSSSSLTGGGPATPLGHWGGSATSRSAGLVVAKPPQWPKGWPATPCGWIGHPSFTIFFFFLFLDLEIKIFLKINILISQNGAFWVC
jgi:hypothetical protein